MVDEEAGGNRKGECRQSCCHFSNSRPEDPAILSRRVRLLPRPPPLASFPAGSSQFRAELSVVSRGYLFNIVTDQLNGKEREDERTERKKRDGSVGISLTTSPREIDDTFSSRER